MTAAATAAASTAPKAPGSGGGGGAAGGSAGPSAGAGGDKVMMDVGARGGYFDEKSPKLLLHEWCTRNKRPKPRYVAQKAPGGQHGCKVVLPDPKGVAERDMVVFLDASLVAPDADEAAQRGAVAALHAVQGDRSLDYVLPARYRMVWRELGQKVRRGRAGARRQSYADEGSRAWQGWACVVIAPARTVHTHTARHRRPIPTPGGAARGQKGVCGGEGGAEARARRGAQGGRRPPRRRQRGHV